MTTLGGSEAVPAQNVASTLQGAQQPAHDDVAELAESRMPRMNSAPTPSC